MEDTVSELLDGQGFYYRMTVHTNKSIKVVIHNFDCLKFEKVREILGNLQHYDGWDFDMRGKKHIISLFYTTGYKIHFYKK